MVQVPLGIHATHHATVIVVAHVAVEIGRPEKALAAIQAFQSHAPGRTQHHSCTSQGIVHAERPFLVGTEHKAASELVVDVAHGHSDEAVVVGGEEIGQAHAFQFFAEAVHLGQESLEADARRKVAVAVVHLAEAIDAQFLAIFFKLGDADAFVEHIILRIGLVAAVHLAVLDERLGTRSKTCQGECK